MITSQVRKVTSSDVAAPSPLRGDRFLIGFGSTLKSGTGPVSNFQIMVHRSKRRTGPVWSHLENGNWTVGTGSQFSTSATFTSWGVREWSRGKRCLHGLREGRNTIQLLRHYSQRLSLLMMNKIGPVAKIQHPDYLILPFDRIKFSDSLMTCNVREKIGTHYQVGIPQSMHASFLDAFARFASIVHHSLFLKQLSTRITAVA